MERNGTFGRGIEETRKQIKAPDNPKMGLIRRVDSPASIRIRLCRFDENLGTCPKIARTSPRKRREKSGTSLFVEQSRRKSKHVRGLSGTRYRYRSAKAFPHLRLSCRRNKHVTTSGLLLAPRVLTHIWRTSNAKKAKRLTDWSGRVSAAERGCLS